MPETTFATLECTRREILRGRYVTTVRWVGPPTGTVDVDPWIVRQLTGRDDLPERLNLGGYPLRKVGENETINPARGVYARADAAFGLAWPWHKLGRAVLPALSLLRGRLVMTLMVWGLAWVPEAEIPSWRHVGKKRG